MKKLQKNVIAMTLIIALLSLMIVSFGCKKDEIPETKDPVYVKNDSVNDNVSIIDSTLAILKSDSDQLSKGIYKFEFNGIPIEYKEGDVIVGVTGNGYLRKVISSTITRNTVVLETEQATLNDLFKQAKINLEMNFTDEVKSKYNKIISNGNKGIVRKTLIDGVSIGSDNSLHIKDVMLYKSDFGNDSVYFKITDASVFFNPNLICNYSFGWLSLKNLEFYFNNASLKIDCNFNLLFGKDRDLIKRDIPIAEFSRLVTIIVGYVPVLILVKIKFIAKLSLNAKAGIEITSGFTNNSNLTLGLLYKSSNGWDYKYGFSNNFILKQVDLNGVFRLEQSFTIVPELSFLVYDVIGPYCSADLYEKFNLNIVNAYNWDGTLSIGVNPKIGVNALIYGDTLFNVFKEYEAFKKILWTAPSTLEAISALVVDAKPYDEIEVKIKVKDNLNNPLKNVTVIFTPSEGGNEIINGIKRTFHIKSDIHANDISGITDENGIATVKWPLGTNKEQWLQVVINRTDGLPVKNSPLNFLARVSNSNPNPTPIPSGTLFLLSLSILLMVWRFYRKK
jgi:hypothetical protein